MRCGSTDDTEGQVSLQGAWQALSSVPQALYVAGLSASVARFTPQLYTKGEYSIAIFIPVTQFTSLAPNISVDVMSDVGLQTLIVSQQTSQWAWLPLGVFNLTSGLAFLNIRANSSSKRHGVSEYGALLPLH
jgi:hypothetical protein